MATSQVDRSGREGAPLRAVLRSPGWVGWAVATFGARLPVAMAPLALVFAGRALSDGYLLSGLLVGAHTIGEAVAAPAAGALIDRWNPRRVLAGCLAAEALLFLAAAVVVGTGGGTVLLVVLVALAGAVPAGAPGGLRSMLTHLVDAAVLPRALSLDTVLNQVCWGLGPVLVGVAVAAVSPAAGVGLTALPAVVAAAAALRLPDPTSARPAAGRSRVLPVLRLLARTLALTAALRVLLGVLTVAAVPLFTGSGQASLAGLALAAYAVGTGLGSVLYSLRSWPGGHQRQADVALLVLGLVVGLTVVARPHAAALLTLYAVAGFFEGPTVLARSLHLERVLPADRRATGFSLQYAAIGWGFAVGSMLLAPLLTRWGAATVVTGAGLAVAALALAAALLPSRPDRAR
ncbi:MFS transporter [Micromonospora wenchangensis]|uniref:MFS transporter n=1 Tax=Micromonospora wenchangensis TaxID=1185415 RepID=UPI003D746C8C